MSRLTLHSSLAVRYDGKRGGSGPLTIGQLNMYRWLSRRHETQYAMLSRAVPVPPGTRVADVGECVAILLARHESLRTTYLTTHPPVQRVSGSGELSIDVYAVEIQPGGSPPDPTRLNAELTALLGAEPMEFSDPPLRVAMATAAGAVVSLVFICSHLAADQQAMGILRREFAELLAEPGGRAVGEVRHQALDRVEVEQRPRHQRRLGRAIRYWRELVGQMPMQLFARPRVGTDDGAGALTMASPASLRAVDHITARTGFNRSSVVLAAVSAVISQRTGYGLCQFPVLSANRFERELLDYVGTLVQSTLVSIDVAGAGFDELVRRAFTAAITGYRHGAYDVYRQFDSIREPLVARGLHGTFEPLLNNLDFTGAAQSTPRPITELDAARARTELTWQPMAPTTALIRFDVHWIDDQLNCRIWTGDTSRIGRSEMADLLLALERLLLAAATGDLTPARIGEALALDPIERGPGWLFVDSCWVELNEVRRLLDDALGPAPTATFADLDGQPMVGYLVAGARAGTPAQAHARCIEALPGRPTAMTPRWYVVCDQAPADPTDGRAWQRQRVLAQGTGRAPLA